MSTAERTTTDEMTPPLGEPSPMVTGGAPSNTMVTMEDLIHTWKPMNFVVNIQTPLVGTQVPFMALRVEPTLPSYERPSIYSDQPDPTVPYNTYGPNTFSCETTIWRHPLVFLGLGTNGFTAGGAAQYIEPYRGAAMFTNGPEPLLSRYTKMFRDWRGSMRYRIRSISNFTNQGYVRVGLVNGVYFKKYWNSNGASFCFPTSTKFNEADSSTNLQNGWLTLDLSEKKHLALEVPYQRNLPFVDRLWEGPYIEINDTVGTRPTLQPNTEQYLVFQLEGTTTSGTNNLIQLSFEYCAGPDFEVSRPIGPFAHELYHSSGDNTIFRPIWFENYSTYIYGDPNVTPTNWPFYRYDTGSQAQSGALTNATDWANLYRTTQENEEAAAMDSALLDKITLKTHKSLVLSQIESPSSSSNITFIPPGTSGGDPPPEVTPRRLM